MQLTTHAVQLPKVILDAYLDILAARVNPILQEEDLSTKAQHNLLWSAARATEKSVCMKFMKELEAAGLFSNVASIDFPAFQWNRGLKFIYAVEMLVPSVVYSLALEMPSKERDLTCFFDYLEAMKEISVDRVIEENLEGAEGPAARRIEKHALGLADANVLMMGGETPCNILRVLNNVRNALNEQVDTPLDSVDADMEYLLPWSTTRI